MPTLTYRDKGTSGTQLAVYSHELRIANIRKQMFGCLAGGGPYWRWTMQMPDGPRGYERHGDGETLDEAKARVERNWLLWVTEAGLADS